MVVDRITGVEQREGRFKLKITGAAFQSGMRVFVGENEEPWDLLRLKSTGLLVLKGGDRLKAVFPEGVAVPILFGQPQRPRGHSFTR